MNHLYRIVWNAHAACWQAVSEIAKGRGKSTAKTHATGLFDAVSIGNRAGEPRLRGLALAVAAALLGVSAPSYAGPEGGNVVRGSASISSADKTTTINQSSDRAVINWSRFSVAADEAVRFNQPSRTSATLNRVTGSESSQIMGRLSANGHVFLLNPNGVLVGQGAQVNVGGFVASSLDMDDDDFMSGKINLKGESEAAVTNEGEITAEEGGTVVLIAPEVNNNGTITANQGSVVLVGASSLTQGATTPAPAPMAAPPAASVASVPVIGAEPAPTAPAAPSPGVVSSPAPSPSGPAEAAPVATVATSTTETTTAPAQIASGGGNTADRFTVRLQDGSNIAFTIDKGAVNALVNNGGLIKAQGGHVILTAKGRDDLSKATVNHSGVIEAQTLTTRNGVVELLADMQVGTVNLSGSINAAAVATVPTPTPVAAVSAQAAPQLRGGFVETSAASVNVTDSAKVTTAGQIDAGIKTGTWLIDPNDYTIAATGGNISGAALGANLASNNVIISTATQGTAGGNGDIFVNDTVSWSANKLTLSAERDVFINQTMNASGTASLALEIGQGADATGNSADFHVRMDPAAPVNSARVNLPEGENFTLKRGLNGLLESYFVITRLGEAGDNNTNTLQGIGGDLISSEISGNYVLGADIAADSTLGWSGGQGFRSIGGVRRWPSGTYYVPWVGNFLGFGHSIDALNINRPSDGAVGLFGYIAQSGVVRDIALIDPTIKGSFLVGALVGRAAGFSGGVWNSSIVGGSVQGTNYVGGMIGHMYSSSHSLTNAAVYSTDVQGIGYVGGLVGVIDGGSVRNSTVNDSVVQSDGDSIGGLVGQLNNGAIDASGVISGVVAGGNSTGGLVGLNNGGTVNNSYASSSVSGRSSVGGLVGLNSTLYSTINNSYASGTVSGLSSYAGGLIGKNDGTVGKSYASGSVSGGTSVGGLVGINNFTINDSYASSSVSGNHTVGGLVGHNNRIISNSYSGGSVSGAYYVGGLVGYDYGGTVSSSYWSAATSGQPTSPGGGTEVSAAQLKQQDTFIGWDFVNTWAMHPGATPTLRNNPAYVEPVVTPPVDGTGTVPAPDAGTGTGANPGIEVTATAPVKPTVIVGSNTVTDPNVVCAKSTFACVPEEINVNEKDLLSLRVGYILDGLKSNSFNSKISYEVDSYKSSPEKVFQITNYKSNIGNQELSYAAGLSFGAIDNIQRDLRGAINKDIDLIGFSGDALSIEVGGVNLHSYISQIKSLSLSVNSISKNQEDIQKLSDYLNNDDPRSSASMLLSSAALELSEALKVETNPSGFLGTTGEIATSLEQYLGLFTESLIAGQTVGVLGVKYMSPLIGAKISTAQDALDTFDSALNTIENAKEISDAVNAATELLIFGLNGGDLLAGGVEEKLERLEKFQQLLTPMGIKNSTASGVVEVINSVNELRASYLAADLIVKNLPPGGERSFLLERVGFEQGEAIKKLMDGVVNMTSLLPQSVEDGFRALKETAVFTINTKINGAPTNFQINTRYSGYVNQGKLVSDAASKISEGIDFASDAMHAGYLSGSANTVFGAGF